MTFHCYRSVCQCVTHWNCLFVPIASFCTHPFYATKFTVRLSHSVFIEILKNIHLSRHKNNNLIDTYPSFSRTGSNSVFSFGLAPTVETTSRKCLTASTCFSVQNFLYNCPVYSSLHGCWADRELTKLPSDWIVFDINVSVRFVWQSCGNVRKKQEKNKSLISYFSQMERSRHQSHSYSFIRSWQSSLWAHTTSFRTFMLMKWWNCLSNNNAP